MTAESGTTPGAEPVASRRVAAEPEQAQVLLIPQKAEVGPSGGTSGPEEIDPLQLLSTVLDILKRRRHLATKVFAATLVLGALMAGFQRLLRPVFSGNFLLLVNDPVISAQSRGTDQSELRELALKPQSETDIPVLTEVLRSPLLLQPIAEKLGISEERIIDHLTIGAPPSGAQGVLDVVLEWNDPRDGEKILDALSKEYLAFSVRQRQEKLAEGLAFLDAQSPGLTRQLVELQEQLSSFRRRNDFLEPIKQGGAIQSQRQQLEARMGMLKQEEAQLLGSMAAVRAGKLSVGSSQGSGEDSTEEVSDLEKQLAEAEASFLPDSPQVRSLRDRVNEVRSLQQRKELEGIEASLAKIRSAQAELERQDRDLTRRFASNPGLVKQYESIQQRLDVARQNLTSYIRTREDFRLAEAQRAVPWRLISPPRFNETPVKPDLRRYLLITVMLGAMAGGGVALLRDQFDQRYHQSIQVEQELGLPLLGDVPFLSEGDESSPQAQESLRKLATNLELLPKARERRMILIASADVGEGRSAVTARLGQTLTNLGQRVLLVDSDLQNPALHKLLGATNGSGFADLLADPARVPEEVIQPLSRNLHLLSVGTTPGEASKLLGSQQGRRTLEQIRNLPGYDLLLFDSPPTLAVGDALLLGREMDGIVFVVGLEEVERSLPAQAIERFRATGAEVLGIVTNSPSVCSENSYLFRGRDSSLRTSTRLNP